ncbi:hypothetical protein V5R04_00365 [Jonesiaceae bacterium BS-20]|uniref:Uncharacterized protein n=1 Tax=Jonesiaceae bacterium BS-20 TaxID=3120821 RepID=A0AAU7DXN5_9MICO
MNRITAAVATALLILGVSQTAGSAAELPRPVPTQVLEFVNHELVPQLQSLTFQGEDGKPLDDAPDFSAITLGSTIQVNLFSNDFQDNRQSDEVLTALDEWLIPIYRADKPIGTTRVWVDGGEVALAGADGDAELAFVLGEFPKDQNLVSYPQANEYYAFNGNSITPLNTPALQFLSGPLSQDEFQKALVERVAETEANAGEGDDLVGGLSSTTDIAGQSINWWGIISLTTGAAALLIAVVAFLQYRTSKRQVSSRPTG